MFWRPRSWREFASISRQLSLKALRLLSAVEFRALNPKDNFKECTKCPEMIVVPAGSFMMAHRQTTGQLEEHEGQKRMAGLPSCLVDRHQTDAQARGLLGATRAKEPRRAGRNIMTRTAATATIAGAVAMVAAIAWSARTKPAANTVDMSLVSPGHAQSCRDRRQQYPEDQWRLRADPLLHYRNRQINRVNVAKLRPAWIFQTDVRKSWKPRRSW